MNFIKRWLDWRRKAVEVLVMAYMHESVAADGRSTQERSIVDGVKGSWPDELKWKPWFITSFEISSALDRLVKRGKLNCCDFYQATGGGESISTHTFALRT